jgi:hypothetical protein
MLSAKMVLLLYTPENLGEVNGCLLAADFAGENRGQSNWRQVSRHVLSTPMMAGHHSADSLG